MDTGTSTSNMVSRKIQKGTRTTPVKAHGRERKEKRRKRSVLVVQCRRVSHPQKGKWKEKVGHMKKQESHRVVAMRNNEINKQDMPLYNV